MELIGHEAVRSITLPHALVVRASTARIQGSG
jgi:hypothetical protein